MQILSKHSLKKLSELEDFLGFVGMYDDQNRIESYNKLIEDNKIHFQNGIFVEAGAGFGHFTKKAMECGASRAYAIEINKYMAQILKKNLKKYTDKTKIIINDIEKVEIKETVDVLLHDFFGPLLYDENLYSLHKLKFNVKKVIPNEGRLVAACIDSHKVCDNTITKDVLKKLKNVLVGDLFEPINEKFDLNVAKWTYSNDIEIYEVDITEKNGDLIVFQIEIFNDGKKICDSYQCQNWMQVWTPRNGNKFKIQYKKNRHFMEPSIIWLK